MLIRAEIPIDAPGIDDLLRRSFPSGAEADLVQRLRKNGLLTLGMVACDDRAEILGYIAYSPITLNKNKQLQWVGLAPLAVDSSCRKQGIAQQLVYNSLDVLTEFGYTAVMVLGDPHYYHRFGFKAATLYQLRCCWPGCEAAFQAFSLIEGALDGVSGLVNYSEEFNRF